MDLSGTDQKGGKKRNRVYTVPPIHKNKSNEKLKVETVSSNRKKYFREESRPSLSAANTCSEPNSKHVTLL